MPKKQILLNPLEKGERPWGHYSVLADTPFCKVKYLVVHAGHRLSLQFHRQRKEHWFIVKGNGVVSINGEHFYLSAGQHVDIPLEGVHRIANQSDKELIFVEVQTGTYFGEDDIERIEDDYSRINGDTHT